MADLDAELGHRLERLAESVPVAPWLGHVEPGPVAARQRIRMAWLTPLLAIVVVGAVVVGPGLLWNAGLLWPNDGPIELWTTQPLAGTVCPLARGSGWLIRHPRSGLGVADREGDHPRAIKWPAGYGARIERGRAALLAPGGTVVAWEGEHVAFGGAGGREPDGTEYFWACTGIEVVPDDVSPTDGPATADPDAGPVVGTESQGPYSIELRSERAVYHESDVIQVTGSFSYLGQTANVVQGFKAGFGVLEPVHGISMQPAYTMECNQTTFEPGFRIGGPFRKSGGVSGSDPQRDFKLEYLRDSEFHLPPGTWHLQYGAFWNEGECGSETTRISTTIEIVVLPDDGAGVAPQTAMEPSASHATEQSALPSGRWPFTSRRRRASRRAPMRTSAGGRSTPERRSSCWGASSGSVPGRGSSTSGRAPAS